MPPPTLVSLVLPIPSLWIKLINAFLALMDLIPIVELILASSVPLDISWIMALAHLVLPTLSQPIELLNVFLVLTDISLDPLLICAHLVLMELYIIPILNVAKLATIIPLSLEVFVWNAAIGLFLMFVNIVLLELNPILFVLIAVLISIHPMEPNVFLALRDLILDLELLIVYIVPMELLGMRQLNVVSKSILHSL